MCLGLLLGAGWIQGSGRLQFPPNGWTSGGSYLKALVLEQVRMLEAEHIAYKRGKRIVWGLRSLAALNQPRSSCSAAVSRRTTSRLEMKCQFTCTRPKLAPPHPDDARAPGLKAIAISTEGSSKRAGGKHRDLAHGSSYMTRTGFQTCRVIP